VKLPALKEIPLRNYPWFLNLQFVNILVPLISYPYLLRVLGPEKYGVIAVANASASIVTTIADYGYGFLGVKDVARISDSPSKLSEYFSRAIFVRSAIYMLLCILFVPLSLFFPFLNSEIMVFSLTLAGVFPSLLFPLWLYIGLQEIRRLNYFIFLQRSLNVALIFLIIRNASDYKIFPIATIIPGIIAAVVGFKYCHSRGIKLQLFLKLDLYRELKDGFSIFISQSVTSIYAQINPLLLMAFLGNSVAVGYYAVGEGIVLQFRSIFSPLNQLFLPFISKKYSEDPIQALKQTKEYARIILIVNVIGMIVLIASAKIIVRIIAGVMFYNSTAVIYILSPSLIFVALNNLAGVHVLLNLDRRKEFLIGILLGAVVHLVLVAALSPIFSYLSAAISWSVSEAVVLLVFVYFISKNRPV
jgi:polysaccharide transporter, PST family